jgi:hypothetical protein
VDSELAADQCLHIRYIASVIAYAKFQ